MGKKGKSKAAAAPSRTEDAAAAAPSDAAPAPSEAPKDKEFRQRFDADTACACGRQC